MTIIAVVSDSREGRTALAEGIAEAKRLGDDLVALDLGQGAKLDLADVDTDGVAVEVVDRRGHIKDDSAEAVFSEIEARNASRLVICIKRRSPVGKVFLGSLSQDLLLNSPIPVLAVKRPADELQTSTLNLPGGVRSVTG